MLTSRGVVGAPPSRAPGGARFAEELARAFDQAAAASVPVSTDLLVGGRRVRVRIAGEELAARTLPALAHLRSASDGRPDATLVAWDGEATGVGLDLPETPEPEPGDAAEPFVVTRAPDLRVVFQPLRGLLTAQAPPEPRATVFVRDARELAWFEAAMPYRIAWSWLLGGERRHVLHAGAVAVEDGAALLVGRGGSGKSTTAVQCLLAGLGYLGDDLVLLDCDAEPWVHSLFSTAKLAARSFELLPALGSPDTRPLVPGQDKIVVQLAETSGDLLRRSAPVRAVICPRVVGSGPSRLVRVSAAHGLRALAPSTVMLVQHEEAAAVAAIARLVAAVPTYALELGERVDDVPDLVRAAVEGTA